MPFSIIDTRVRPKRMLCEGECVDTQFRDLVFVVEAHCVDDGAEAGQWLTCCKGKEPVTFHNYSNAECYRMLMARRFGLERAA